jgi:hypothetical protein
MRNVAPTPTIAPETLHRMYGQFHPPTLQQAMDFEVNESKRGVRLVRMADLPDHRLRELAEAAQQLYDRYGSSTFWYQGQCAALVLKHRRTEGAR